MLSGGREERLEDVGRHTEILSYSLALPFIATGDRCKEERHTQTLKFKFL
jgi:hypothetical protein